MKKLMVVLAGFGVILLAGSWADSAAQETSSILSPNRQLIDSSDTLSLQEKAEKNLAYSKPAPADPGKVGGEFLVGAMGAAAGGVIGARLGFGIGSDGGGGFFDEGGFIGALVGYMVLSNVGCATGVCLVGNSGGEKGSYGATLGGSILGTVVGGTAAFFILAGSDDDAGWPAFFLLPATQAGGATIGFTASRNRKVEAASGALLNLDEGKLALAFPQLNLSQDSSNPSEYKVNLLQANF